MTTNNDPQADLEAIGARLDQLLATFDAAIAATA